MFHFFFSTPTLHLDSVPWISILLLMNPFLLRLRIFLMIHSLRPLLLIALETLLLGQGLDLDEIRKKALVHVPYGFLPLS